MRNTILIACIAGITCTAAPAMAKEVWLAPQKKQCTLEPGQDCGMDVKCAADTPFVMSGGGGMPKVSNTNHRLAMTMNVAISPNAWRVRWRNFGEKSLDVTVMIRALCSSDGAAWGK